MTSVSRTRHTGYPPQAQWTGRAEIDLKNSRGQWVGTVEVVVRLDNVSLWFGNRTLAVMDRDIFREWLIHPTEIYQIDDVAWTMLGPTAFLAIDTSPPYPVPAPTMKHLVSVI